MEKRTIEIDLETAQVWYKTNWELKRLALKIFTKEELENVLPKTWNNWYYYQSEEHKYYIDEKSNIQHKTLHSTPPNDIHRNCLNSKQDAEAHLTLMQLHVLRDAYRDNYQRKWKPDWENINQSKYSIVSNGNNFEINNNHCISRFLSFPTEELAEKFLANFKHLIEEAKDLI